MDFVFFINVFNYHAKEGEYQSVFALCSYDAATADLVFELHNIRHHFLGTSAA